MYNIINELGITNKYIEVIILNDQPTKKDNNFIPILYYWGAFFGWVIGMIFTKVYQLWAVWFYGEGSRIAGVDGWWTNSPPLWATAYNHPHTFNVVLTTFFIIMGLLFVKFLLEYNFITTDKR